MSMHRVRQERKDRATLRGAGGDHRPDTFAPPAAFLAPRPLGDLPAESVPDGFRVCLGVPRNVA
jgi:hypothetical protein